MSESERVAIPMKDVTLTVRHYRLATPSSRTP